MLWGSHIGTRRVEPSLPGCHWRIGDSRQRVASVMCEDRGVVVPPSVRTSTIGRQTRPTRAVPQTRDSSFGCGDSEAVDPVSE